MVYSFNAHFSIFFTIFFALLSQIIMKWQMGYAGNPPTDFFAKIGFMLSLLINPWVLGALAATFVSGLCWMYSLIKFPLSYAYPFISLLFPFMALMSHFIFKENLTWHHFVSTGCIVLGVVVLVTK